MPKTTRIRSMPLEQIASSIRHEREAERAQREAERHAAEAAAKPAHRDPRNKTAPPSHVVLARLAGRRVVPTALRIPCAAHGAPAGAPCVPTARGVCGPRVTESLGA